MMDGVTLFIGMFCSRLMSYSGLAELGFRSVKKIVLSSYRLIKLNLYDNIVQYDYDLFNMHCLNCSFSFKELFGSCGRVETGWQIDPFGHSKEFASILADMNYKYLLFGRIDYQEKKQRQMDCNMEFSWKLDQQKNITGNHIQKELRYIDNRIQFAL